jgi:hypothetical protein
LVVCEITKFNSNLTFKSNSSRRTIVPIDFGKTFGSKSNNVQSNGASSDKPKAQFWLNVGYVPESAVEENPDYNFVSLASGIPLDTMQTLPTNSKNQLFAAFQSARNELRDQLIAAAKELKPGEAQVISTTGPLAIQIRRVGEDAAPVPTETNPFSRNLFAAEK